jgi:hypothetical protein
MDKTPIGFKINLTSLTDTVTLDCIIKSLETYHKGIYIVGKDTHMSLDKKPHYHIHFWALRKVTTNALKTFRCEALKKKFDTLTRSDKLYTGQDLPNADPLRWYAYAIKEEFVTQSGLDDEIEELKKLALIEREFKKIKLVNSEKITEKNNVKKELKEKLFSYIQDEYRRIAPQPNDDRFDSIFNTYEEYLMSHEYICNAIIRYYITHDMYGHLGKTIIERYYKEYLVKKGKDENDLYKIIFSR